MAATEVPAADGTLFAAGPAGRQWRWQRKWLPGRQQLVTVAYVGFETARSRVAAGAANQG